MRHIALLLIALMLGATRCDAASVEGSWYGTVYQSETRQTMEWLAILRPDGALSIESRIYENCQLKSVRLETGWWTASKGIITNKILTVDGRAVRDETFSHRMYRILEHDDHHMRFAHQSSGLERTVERVGPEFAFPGCKNMS